MANQLTRHIEPLLPSGVDYIDTATVALTLDASQSVEQFTLASGSGAPATVRDVASGSTGSSTTAASVTVTLPSTVVAGDLILACCGAGANAGAVITAPTGADNVGNAWNQYDDQSSNTIANATSAGIWYKFATSADISATHTWRVGTATRWGVCYLIIKDVDSSFPLDNVSAPADVLPSASSTSITYPSITPNTTGDLLVIASGHRTLNTSGTIPPYTVPSTPSGFTKNVEVATASATQNNGRVVMCSAAYNSLTATGVITATVTQVESWVGMSAVVKGTLVAQATPPMGITTVQAAVKRAAVY